MTFEANGHVGALGVTTAQPPRPVVREPWPQLPQHCVAPAERLARLLEEQRGSRLFTAVWERSLAERARAVVEEALRAPQQHGLEHGAARRFWEDPVERDLLVASVVIRASMFWPLSLLIYGCRTAEDIRRAYGCWLWENVERTVVLEGNEPAEFRAASPREADERVIAWLRERVLSVEAPGARALTETTPEVTAVYQTAERGPARFAAVIAPALAGVDALALTIRVRREDGPETLADLVAAGALDEGAAEFLRWCVVGRLNQVVAGDTGTGKTTFQAALCREFPEAEVVLTAELGGAELELRSRRFRDGRPAHDWTIETTAVGEGERAVASVESLIRHGLRHRPARIFVPETRGGEMFEVLQAVTSGHPGGITTLHARRLEEVPERMRVMVLQAAGGPSEALARHLIDLGLEVCTFLSNRGGRHVVDAIAVYSEQGAATMVYRRDGSGVLQRQVTHVDGLPQRIRRAVEVWGAEVPGVVIGVLAPLVLLLLGAACLLALELAGAEVAAVVPGPLRRGVARLVESERAFAAGLGWAPGRWLALRALLLAGATVAGVLSGVPVLLALYAFLGATVPRFVLATRVDRRRVVQARAFLSFMAQVGERLRARDLELAAVVRAAAREVPQEVESLLAPVAAAGGDVFGVLTRQVAAQRSAPLERCCALLRANRARDLSTLTRLIGEEVASLEADLDEEDQRVAARGESRWTTLAMGAVTGGFAALLNTVPGMHQVFVSPRGQLGLIVAVGVFAVAALVMGLLLRSPGMSRWDLERMHRELLEAGE